MRRFFSPWTIERSWSTEGAHERDVGGVCKMKRAFSQRERRPREDQDRQPSVSLAAGRGVPTPPSRRFLCGLCVAVAQLATTSSAAASREALLQISDSAMFGEPTRVEIREALFFDSLSVFIGKTGMVRNRGGMVAGVVVLSSQELGCGRFQQAYPAVLVVGEKRARQFDERIAVTRPRADHPPVSFSPKGPGDFEIWAVARFVFDPKEIEERPTYRPTTYRFLEGLLAPSEIGSVTPGERVTRGPLAPLLGDAGGFSFVFQEAGSVELRPKEFDVSVLDYGSPAGSEAARFRADLSSIERKPPVMAVSRTENALHGIVDVKNKRFAVQAGVELTKCPPLEHIHIEPKE